MVDLRRTITGSNPIVTVIIPVHNGEKTIERCIRSVLDQSFQDFEVVVVDNASNDSTREIILSLSKNEPRVIYVYEDRKGRGHARAKGVRYSHGIVLAWTDSDCQVPREWLKGLIGPIMIDDEIAVQGNADPVKKGFWSSGAQDADQRHLDHQVRDPPYIDHVDTKNFAIRKDVLMDVGGFDERLKALEDFELKIRLKKKGKQIFYVRDLRVKHHHRESFRKLFRSRFEQGYWAAVIFKIHKDFFNSEKGMDNTIKSMYILDTIMFPLHLIKFLFHHGPRKFIFEAVTGYIWRLGNLKGRIFWRGSLGCKHQHKEISKHDKEEP